MINILILGDIFGRVGREQLKKRIPNLKNKLKLDFIIINGENATHGKSLSLNHYLEFKKIGIDAITMGNHTFALKDIINKTDQMSDVIRPYNFGFETPGIGTKIYNVKNLKIRVTNLLGRTFMKQKVDNPFIKIEKLIKNDNSDIHIVDFHAEATAEKISFAMAYDGQLTAVIGTHTHVQTNDARILKKGTFFITDLGMTGPINSIIGVEPEEIIFNERTSLPVKMKPASGPGQLCGVLIKIDEIFKKVIDFKVIFKKDKKWIY